MANLPSTEALGARATAAARRAGIAFDLVDDGAVPTRSPITGGPFGSLAAAQVDDVDALVARSRSAFATWRATPAPSAGALVRRFAELLREHKGDLAAIVTVEAGKIGSEALGEVQEMIDVCDFAVGLSRQLHGLTIASRAPRSSADGDLAPARAVRGDHRLQLPGRGVGVERRPRPGVRRHRGVEAERAHLALRPRRQRAAAAGGGRGRRPRGRVAGRNRRSIGRGASRRPPGRAARRARPARPRWVGRWRRSSPAGSDGRCSSWAATTGRSSPPAPTCRSPCGPSCSPPPAPPGSAAPRCAG